LERNCWRVSILTLRFGLIKVGRTSRGTDIGCGPEPEGSRRRFPRCIRLSEERTCSQHLLRKSNLVFIGSRDVTNCQLPQEALAL
jgi:hypothetical protein